jgi:hypothetical protein
MSLPVGEDELVATARGGYAVHLLYTRHALTTREMAMELEVGVSAAWKILMKVGTRVPVYLDDDGYWRLLAVGCDDDG